MMTIADNVQAVQKRIAEACDRSNRDYGDVKLVAVSKRKPVSDILEAIEVGVQHFGENRVEESEEKIPQLKSNQQVIWHMLGHIQSRKAKSVASMFHFVHSIDSVRIAEKLAQTIDGNRQLNALIQVNVSGEETKGGLDAFGWKDDATIRTHLWQNVQSILQLPQLNIIGLMTMAPIVTDVEQTRPFFSALATLRNELQDFLSVSLPELSMGMTDDYPVAIEEGATLVRIGRAIFGERKY